MRGPDDRRGNKWKDLVEAPDNENKTVLVSEAYDKALMVRDNVHRDPWINALLTQGDGINESFDVCPRPEDRRSSSHPARPLPP